jgi:hypothetical protein
MLPKSMLVQVAIVTIVHEDITLQNGVTQVLFGSCSSYVTFVDVALEFVAAKHREFNLGGRRLCLRSGLGMVQMAGLGWR